MLEGKEDPDFPFVGTLPQQMSQIQLRTVLEKGTEKKEKVVGGCKREYSIGRSQTLIMHI